MFQAPVRENISEVLFSLLCLNEKEKSRSPYGLRDFGTMCQKRYFLERLAIQISEICFLMHGWKSGIDTFKKISFIFDLRTVPPSFLLFVALRFV